MSKPNEGFDLDNYDFTEYASALDGENLSNTDCDMESESIWTPARRHKKRKASRTVKLCKAQLKRCPKYPNKEM